MTDITLTHRYYTEEGDLLNSCNYKVLQKLKVDQWKEGVQIQVSGFGFVFCMYISIFQFLTWYVNLKTKVLSSSCHKCHSHTFANLCLRHISPYTGI